MLKLWLVAIAEPAVQAIDLIAMLIIVFASAKTFVMMLVMLFRPGVDNHARRAIWLEYGRWLVAALTFQLAADIIESSIVPTWEGIGQLGAIAAIRTFLNYFLERDISDVRERQLAGTAMPRTGI